jgi:hypothetical protein
VKLHRQLEKYFDFAATVFTFAAAGTTSTTGNSVPVEFRGTYIAISFRGADIAINYKHRHISYVHLIDYYYPTWIKASSSSATNILHKNVRCCISN